MVHGRYGCKKIIIYAQYITNYKGELKIMKKSECFKLAQIAVIDSDRIANEEIKLEIIKVLLKEEEFATYTEKEEEKEKRESQDVCS